MAIARRSLSLALPWALVAACAIFAAQCGARKARGSPPFFLERLSQTYLPSWYANGGKEAQFCMGSATAEQVAFDADQLVLYVAGFKVLHVMDLVRPEAPLILGHIDLPGDGTDVVVCGGLVAVAVPGTPKTSPGHVELYSAYERGHPDGNMQQIFRLEVGALPDMLTFTPNCSHILVANEGEAGRDEHGEFKNPEGGVSVIDVLGLLTSPDPADAIRTANFSAWNDRADQLSEDGVRWVWRGQTKEAENSFSADLEPEYIAVSKDGSTAYINLQENNAIAVMDISAANITSILPLGYKEFGPSLAALDASRDDGGPSLNFWDISTTYQPDGVAVFRDKGKEYLATANEGAQSHYTWHDHNVGDWNDVTHGSNTLGEIDPTTTPASVKAALGEASALGNFRVSEIDGLASGTAEGEKIRERLVGFGARSFTIFDTRDMTPVYDSSDDLERLTLELFPWSFNSATPGRFCPTMADKEMDLNVDSKIVRLVLKIDDDEDIEALSDQLPDIEEKMITSAGKVRYMDPNTLSWEVEEAKRQLKDYEETDRPEDHGKMRPSNALTSRPEDLVDRNSPLGGPEPETLAVGVVENRRLLFLGVEKSSAVFVYDITNPRKPLWQSAVYSGMHNTTWAELFNEKLITDVDPEAVEFIDEEHSPTGEPLLVVAGSLSGTVSIYRVSNSLPVGASAPKTSRRTAGVIIPTADPTTTVAVNARLISKVEPDD
eukprot:evm.model.scf_664.4 EVM.evm.TU.scf_664.4   scf_664:26489-33952(-)